MDHVFNTALALLLFGLAFEWGREGYVRGVSIWAQWTRFAVLVGATVGVVTSLNPTLDWLGYDKLPFGATIAAALRVVFGIVLLTLIVSNYRYSKSNPVEDKH